MDSFLLTGPISKSKEYAYDFLKKEKIDKLDITTVESEKAVGIALVKEFQKKIYLKPYKSDKKAVILQADQGLTTEAQNALLKVLEEPPANTIIIVLSQSSENILPTIISRCMVISMETENELTDTEKYEKILGSLKSKGVGEKLRLAQDFSKDRETALEFLKNLLLASENLLKYGDKNMTRTVKLLHETYKEVKNTNTNLRLTMEHLFLSV
jgi:DNA polymerase III, delta subunit